MGDPPDRAGRLVPIHSRHLAVHEHQIILVLHRQADRGLAVWGLVDLPGYGYAKVSKDMRDQFNEFVSEYLTQRENLCGTFVLIDSRHTPQKLDLQFVQWLIDCELPFALIFTKTDKIKPKVVQKNIGLFKIAMKEFSAGEPVVFESSVTTRTGRKEILGFIEDAMQQVE